MNVYLNDDVHQGQLGLSFVGENRLLYHNIKSLIIGATRWLDHPDSKVVRGAHPFIQSDNSDYLLVEFWTDDIDKILEFCNFFAERFNFTYQECSIQRGA